MKANEYQAGQIIADVMIAFGTGHVEEWIAAHLADPGNVPMPDRTKQNWFKNHDEFEKFFDHLMSFTRKNIENDRGGVARWKSNVTERTTVLAAARVHGQRAFRRMKDNNRIGQGLTWDEVEKELDFVRQNICPSSPGGGSGWVCGEN